MDELKNEIMLRPPFWSVAVETVGDDVTRVFEAAKGLDPLPVATV